MPDILHQIGISTKLKTAMNAVTTLEGISQWWATCDGQYKVRDKFTIQLDKQTLEMKVISKDKNRVEWRCTDGSSQWKKTRLIFKFKKNEDDIILNFSHRDWKESSQGFRRQNTQWAILLLKLKKHLESQ